ncbi:phage tail protein [Sphingomonas sp. CFBP 13714]|uniref:phage tail protein n=1 Tax=Sphingomonas sp. CFBP 13714 TaxID=2775308 RepID=UPI001781B2AB|nr:phage tail protein [Sphingomonas sp. CFBP 13714]MBD8699024.1 phage tail protein [Sphingomonas sp. CFBP 13714]
MKKPESLRQTLQMFVPALAADPSRLSIFVDKGRIAAGAGSLSLEYRYTANIVVQDYAGDVDDLMVPILAWIAQHQPDLLQHTDQEPFRFESELLDAETADVSIFIDLDEAVRVSAKEGGGFIAERTEPAGDPDSFGIRCVPLWQLLMGDQVVAQTNDPRFVANQ